MRNGMMMIVWVFGLVAAAVQGGPAVFMPKLRVALTPVGSQSAVSSATVEGRDALAKMSKEDQTAVREFVQAMDLYREDRASYVAGGSATIQELYGTKGHGVLTGDDLTQILLQLTGGDDVRFLLEIDDNLPIQGRLSLDFGVENHRFHFSLEILKKGSVVRMFRKIYALRPGAGDRKIYYGHTLARAIELATSREAWRQAENRVQEAQFGHPSDEFPEAFEEVLRALER
jgi:hypothetical protein